jgi:hypothetical protein
MTKSLSPAAQAVLDAFLGDAENTGLQMDDLRENVAAALEAAANQVEPDDGVSSEVRRVLDRLLAIAAELKQ